MSEIEGRYNWRGPPYHMIIHALETVLHLNKKNICLKYNYRVYKNLSWIFLIQMECSSAKHVKSYGRAAHVSCISLLFHTPWSLTTKRYYILGKRGQCTSNYCRTHRKLSFYSSFIRHFSVPQIKNS